MVKNEKNTNKKDIKHKMFYARTYRHLKANYKNMALYYLLFCLPCLILFLVNYSKLTKIVSNWGLNILSFFVPASDMSIVSSEFIPRLGDVFYVSMPTKMPSLALIITNIVVVILSLIVCYNAKDKAKPIAIYSIITLLIHLFACIFFLVTPETFPYTLTQYSGLYMKQQVGIWLSFFVIASIVSGGISKSGMSKLYMLLAVMSYSFIFGCLRYVIFAVILLKASSLYMAMLFFMFGSFFDFLYLVCIYSIYLKHLTKKFDDKEGDMKWNWA